MPGAKQSSKLLTSLRKTEEMHKQTSEAKGKVESAQALHRSLLSLMNIAHGLTSQASD